MKTTKARQDPQQAMLAEVTVRLIGPEEQERFDELIRKEHYLKNATWVGRRLFYVAEHQGQWLALLAWTSAAYNLKDREDWLGWSAPQRKRRRALVVNNSRFLILPDAHHANLATRVMRLCLDRLSADWLKRFGHEVLLAESFVDGERFRGTCYRAGGWLHLGQTKGWSRNRSDFYEQHDRPKQLWVRELRRGARELLAARSLPEAYASVEKGAVPECELQPEALSDLRAYFDALPDWRSKSGDYPCSGLAALVACATLCGVHRGQRSLAAFARELNGVQLQSLGFRKKGRPRRYRAPSEATFCRFLAGVSSTDLEKALQKWQNDRLGPRKADDNVIAVDGKALCSSQGVEVVSAYACKSGRWLGSELVQDGSNEIPAAQKLLGRIDLEGQRVTLDALHTQERTARIIVQEGGGDYLMTVKGNQPGIVADLQTRRESLHRDFSPQRPQDLVQHYEINRSRPEARSLLRFDITPAQAGFPHAAQAAEMKRFIDRQTKADLKVEREYLLTSIPASQLDAEQMLRLDRDYWGIESGLHQRLDISAQEDKSRVRSPKAALNLCLFRRASMSFAIHWIRHQKNKRLATTSGFYDEMRAKGFRKAFSLVTTKYPSWLPPK